MDRAETVRRLLDTAGTTFAEEAGIDLEDKPAALYRLLILAVLLSGRVQAQLGTRACRELVSAGYGSPLRMRDAGRQEVFDALDPKAIAGAQALALPSDRDALAALVDAGDRARFSAALVRAALSGDVAETVTA